MMDYQLFQSYLIVGHFSPCYTKNLGYKPQQQMRIQNDEVTEDEVEPSRIKRKFIDQIFH